MNYLKRFEKGTEHQMAKGTLKVKSYEEKNDVLYMTYTLNDDSTEYTKKYVNVISGIYKYQKRHNVSGTVEAALSSTPIIFKTEKLIKVIEDEIEQEKINPDFPHAYFTLSREVMYDLAKQHIQEDVEVKCIKSSDLGREFDLVVVQIADRQIGIRRQLLDSLIA